jgi:type I restriction enzyme S subunit
MNLNINIPKGWEETTLGKVCDNVSRKFDFSSKEKVVFINTGDVLDGIFLHKTYSNKKGLPGQAKKAIKKGDILFSEIRPKNKRYALVDCEVEDFVVSTKFMVISRKEKLIDLEFLYIFLTSDKKVNEFNIIAESRSGTFPQITFESISYISVLLPPIEEQKSIANIITALDDKIENLKNQNKTLEQTAKTIFKEWFSKYQIGDELPDEWKISPINELVDTIIDYRGKTPKKLGMDWSESGIPALSAKTIKKGKIVRRDAMNFGDEALYDLWMKDELQKGDILLTSEAPLGEMYYINDDKKYILSQRLFALRVNENITSQYLYHYLFSRYGQHLLQARASGSTVEGIRQSELRKIEVIIPDSDSLEKASSLFQNIFDKKHNNSKQIQSLKETRNELLPKLMSGEIRIKEFIK